MIVYSKALWGVPLSLHFGRGSPLTRNLLLPLLSILETALLYIFTCRHVVAPLTPAEGDDGGEGESDSHCSASSRSFI
jgi:hypothetical protein